MPPGGHGGRHRFVFGLTITWCRNFATTKVFGIAWPLARQFLQTTSYKNYAQAIYSGTELRTLNSPQASAGTS